MKAAQLDRYAKAGRLVVREVPVPEPAANEVLVKVRAAAVNPLELLLVAGSVRLIQDYRLPQTLGNECSGVVERVGSKVGKFRPGDAVYTRLPLERIGAFAEYVVVEEAALAKMPAGYAFDVAAAVPLTGLKPGRGWSRCWRRIRGKRCSSPADRAVSDRWPCRLPGLWDFACW